MKNVIEVKRKPNNAPKCQHLSIELNEQDRYIRCLECDSIFDAFDYIWEQDLLADKITWRVQHLVSRQAELEVKVESLRNELKNLKDEKKATLK